MCPKTEVRGKQGHAVHKTMCFNKILMMAATKYGHQPGQRLGWAALAYHKQEDANPDPGPRKHCLQNDGKPDERFGVRVGTWNIGSMSGRGTEVCEELRKRRMDVCCLQEGGEDKERGFWA